MRFFLHTWCIHTVYIYICINILKRIHSQKLYFCLQKKTGWRSPDVLGLYACVSPWQSSCSWSQLSVLSFFFFFLSVDLFESIEKKTKEKIVHVCVICVRALHAGFSSHKATSFFSHFFLKKALTLYFFCHFALFQSFFPLHCTENKNMTAKIFKKNGCSSVLCAFVLLFWCVCVCVFVCGCYIFFQKRTNYAIVLFLFFDFFLWNAIQAHLVFFFFWIEWMKKKNRYRWLASGKKNPNCLCCSHCCAQDVLIFVIFILLFWFFFCFF